MFRPRGCCHHRSESSGWNHKFLNVSFVSDVFKQGIWKEVAAIDDPELRELAGALPSLALQGKAPSTVKKYSGAFCRWRKWISSKRALSVSLPPKPLHLALYLSFLAQHCKTSSPLLEAISALSRVNQLAMVEDTTTHPLVVQVLAGAKRQLACPTIKKEPITPEILTKIVDKTSLARTMHLFWMCVPLQYFWWGMQGSSGLMN